MICLGIESTAHTFSVGIINGDKIIANVRDMYVPEKGGINPLDAKEHHVKIKEEILDSALADAKIQIEDVSPRDPAGEKAFHDLEHVGGFAASAHPDTNRRFAWNRFNP